MSRDRSWWACLLALAGLLVSAPAAGAISGGRRVQATAYPWFARVGDDICAAVLVTADRLATDASCAELREGDRVVVGGQRLRVSGVSFPSAVVAAQVAGRVVSCDRDDQPVSCKPDLALLHLSQAVSTPPPTLVQAVAGEAATVVGHGTTSIDDSQTAPARLRAADLRVIEDAECRRRYRSIDRGLLAAITPADTLCADDPSGPKNAGLCVGDGGAPLVANRDGAPVLLGIGSLAAGCGEQGEPSVFTDTWQYRDFVLGKLPVWRPYSRGDARITGRGRVGRSLTCHAPRFVGGAVDRVIYWFLSYYDERTLQRGRRTTYRVRRRDRGDEVTCWALAVNAGGVYRAVTDFGTITVR
jgi:Trypsin